MVDKNKLRGTIVEHGTSVAEVAKNIGVDKSTIYRKLADNGEPITIREADGIVKFLDLSADEATRIFFAQFVAD